MKITIFLCYTFLGVYSSVIPDNLESDEEINPLVTPTIQASQYNLQSNVNSFNEARAKLEPVESPSGTLCECGLFKGIFATELDEPFISHSPDNVTCDYEGHEKCIQLCSKLDEAVEQYGPHLLCPSLGDYNHLVVSVHSRVCGVKQWSYTGLSSSTTMCCRDRMVIDCSELGNHSI